MRPVLGIMQCRRQHRDIAGDLAETEILHQHAAEFFQRGLLVLAVHRRAGVDDIAQRGMVVAVGGGMLDHHLEDGRHREDVADAVAFDQPEGLADIETIRRQQDGRHAARGLHELMDARAMRQRRHHQRRVMLGGAGHEVAEVIGHHKGHLAMGQHRRLGAPGGAGGEEEPAGVVVLDRSILDPGAGMRLDRRADGLLAEGALADPPDKFERGTSDRGGMVGKVAVTQKRLGAGRGGEIGDLVRQQPEIGRHPDRAKPERSEHRPEHLVAILGMDQDAVALDDAARGKRRRQRRDQRVDFAPGPGPLAPDEANAVAVAAGVLGEQMRQVHHPARHPCHAAARRRHGDSPGHLTLTFFPSTCPPPAAPGPPRRRRRHAWCAHGSRRPRAREKSPAADLAGVRK